MSATNGSIVSDSQQQHQQRQNEEFIPGDNIAQFYIFFGIALIVPYSFFMILRNDPSSLGLFAYHPPMLALALGALAYGISPLQPAAHPDTAAAALDVHGLFVGLISLPLFVIGASLMWQQKENRGKDHFVTWHGTFGALGATAVLFQGLAGFVLAGGYLPKKIQKVSSVVRVHPCCPAFGYAFAWWAFLQICGQSRLDSHEVYRVWPGPHEHCRWCVVEGETP